MLTKQQRLQQEFDAPWLRLLRSIPDVEVEDLAGGQAALEVILKRGNILEAAARQCEQHSKAHRDALDAAGQSCSQFQACSLCHARIAMLREACLTTAKKWLALLVYLTHSHALQRPERMQYRSS